MILVTGVGRSGTSFTARVLSEELEVEFGPHLPPPNRVNPHGSFEDIDVHAFCVNRGRGLLTPEEWRLGMEDALSGREEPWGLKEPRLCLYLEEFEAVCPAPIYPIRCTRAREDVLSSWLEVCATTEEKARREIRRRARGLGRWLAERDHLLLDMTKRWEESELASEVRGWLKAKRAPGFVS